MTMPPSDPGNIIDPRPRHPTWSLEEQDLYEAAFHEAGHAVLAKVAGTYLLGLIDARVGQPRGEFNCTYKDDLFKARAAALGARVNPLLEEAVIAAGGGVAQARFLQANKIGLDDAGRWTECADKHISLSSHVDLTIVHESLGSGHWVPAVKRAHFWFDQPAIWACVERLARDVIRRDGLMLANPIDDLLHEAFVELDIPDYQVLVASPP